MRGNFELEKKKKERRKKEFQSKKIPYTQTHTCNVFHARSSANTSETSATPGGLWECSKCLDEMRLMQRLAISGLLSVILIVLLTGTFVTRRDLANVVERGAAPEERGNEQQQQQQQANPPAWVQSNVIPGQDEAKPPLEDKDRWADSRQRQSEPSAVGPPPLPVPGPYVIKPPNPPLDDVTNQRREKIKEVSGSTPCLLSSSVSLSLRFLSTPVVCACVCVYVVIINRYGSGSLVFFREGWSIVDTYREVGWKVFLRSNERIRENTRWKGNNKVNLPSKFYC